MTVPSAEQLILSLCQFRTPNTAAIRTAFTESPNLPYILGQLLFHRVGGIALNTLEQCALLLNLNREFRNPLQMLHTASVLRTESFLLALESLGEILADVNFAFALLKGSYLVQRYPLGTRTSNDIDVLIERKNVGAISKLLLANGFTQGFLRGGVFTPATRAEIIFAQMNKGETVPFVKCVDLPQMPYLEIDLNFSLGFGGAKDGAVVGDLLSRTEPRIETSRGNLPTLAPADFLIHLCAHLYKEATTWHWVQAGRDLSLYKFVDIYVFITDFLNADFAAQLAERIAALGLEKECAYTFIYTRALFALENQNLDALIQSITPEDTAFLTQVIDPVGKRILAHELDFVDYLFHPNRTSILEEVGAWKL
jgi:hypothetical protein